MQRAGASHWGGAGNPADDETDCLHWHLPGACQGRDALRSLEQLRFPDALSATGDYQFAATEVNTPRKSWRISVGDSGAGSETDWRSYRANNDAQVATVGVKVATVG